MKKKRVHVGVLFTSLDDPCQYAFWSGTAAYAKKRGIHLSAYVGVYQKYACRAVSFYNTCFELIKHNKSLDGLIAMSGFMLHHMRYDKLEKAILDLSKHLPVISISHSIPGVPSILIDNNRGIFDAVNHLIKVHGKRRIAFVRGPQGHEEANRRLEGYKEALEANGLTFDKNLIMPGDFSKESGKLAVKQLLRLNPGSFDAIAASDDETAVGILAELKNNGIAVPMEIAVTGFDDEKFASTYIPSISTVRQDFSEISSIGMKTLLNMAAGKPVNDVTYVTPVFIMRQSCGCLSEKISNTPVYSKEEPRADCLYSYVNQGFNTVFKDIVPAAIFRKWASSIAAFLKEKNFDNNSFLDIISEALIYYSNYSGDYSLWSDALNTLTMCTVLHGDEVGDVYSVRSALINTSALIESFKYMEAKTNDFTSYDERRRTNEVLSDIVLHFDIPSLSKVVQKSLPELQINTIIIGLYHSPVKNNACRADRTFASVFGYDYGNKINHTCDNKHPMSFADYLSIESFDYNKRRRELLFFPLFFEEEQLGAMLISYNADIPADVFETLRTNISSAVKGTALLSRIEALSVTDEHTGLFNRRGFFHLAYSRLQHLSRIKDLIPLVLFMDMDGLKAINDTYGHKEGDRAIAAFADTLKEALREEDIIGRIGGDEFIVLSAVKTEDSGKLIVDRIRKMLSIYNENNNYPYRVMASIGYVVLDSCDARSFDAAILKADSILYEEKSRKKGRTVGKAAL